MADIEFISDNGTILKITVYSYEFPDASEHSDEFDKNWLIADIELTGKGFMCKIFGPNLMTTELKSLLDNIVDFQNNKITDFELAPMEPYFDFKVEPDDNNKSNIKISGYIIPDNTEYIMKNEFKFMFSITPNVLKLVSEQIMKLLINFPVR